MKLKTKNELHNKTITELRQGLQEAQNELALLKLDFVQGKLKNTSSLFHKRKNIAKIQTILREKELNNNENI